ncbi:MAG: hypothetical protein RLZZ387_3137 [Chloroflexota bacterium]|jgi:hypothetical protein
MPVDLRYEDDGAILVVRAVGSYGGRAGADAAIVAIAEHARARGRQCVLVDMRQMSGSIPQLDRFLVGKRAGQVWGRRLKVAFIARAEDISHFFENVAVNEGAVVRVFGEEEEARRWLLGGKLA